MVILIWVRLNVTPAPSQQMNYAKQLKHTTTIIVNLTSVKQTMSCNPTANYTSSFTVTTTSRFKSANSI